VKRKPARLASIVVNPRKMVPTYLLQRSALSTSVLLLAFFLAPWLHAQTVPAEARLPAPPGVRVIRLNPTPGMFSEPSIALNPADPQQLVAAFQVNASAAYSRDAGDTWTIADGTAPPDYHRSGDVSVAFDHHGHAFLCYIAFDKLGTENYWAHNATRNGIFVRGSSDGGKTWDKDPATVIAHPSDPGIPFEDKPYIVADSTHSKYAGNLYVGWTEFSLDKSIMLFSRSTDEGRTWSKPIEISTKEGLPRDDNGAVEGFTGAVGADGTLYVVWCDISGSPFRKMVASPSPTPAPSQRPARRISVRRMCTGGTASQRSASIRERISFMSPGLTT
jgi:hypothetical protein